ncbi:zinc finger with UFM1-specific peptidase domain protein isoform X1 [Arachis ipaensis]|uniref:zinc finger with UFM1-specific peptidase domain protein isoform X1 n=1 Tax=Arachis ipaensis TaxID=130454 RepID=UPI000A2B44D2|nr:zinc finger with UFM1-specific peptidase domain protein isoform X1 [Arachis ipaensis]XP_029150026.1 zinc finger-containing ubiquitin peptidase 1 isoform X1 [Arachis hypogaea]
MDSSSICPFCHSSVPSSQLQWHANNHFEHDDLQRATDFELAQQLALSPNSPPRKQAASGLHSDKTHGGSNNWYNGIVAGRHNGAWKVDEKISCLVDLQRKSEFYKIEAGLIALLKNCLESEAENSRTILSGYVDHFQSLEFEDVGWGCGWRNLQMLSSHLLVQRPQAREVLFGGSGFVPDISSLQRWLEIAWGRDFDPPGADQFNHAVYGSRKWIGTTECAALLRSFGLRARVVDFGPKEYESLYLSVPGSSVGALQPLRTNNWRKRKAIISGPMDRYLSRTVSQSSCSQKENSCSSPNDTDSNANISKGHQALMDFVWNYFSNNSSIQFGHRRVIVCEKTPLYFQHDGHSRTIVGIQVKHQRTGTLQYNLLILDPAHKTASLEKSLREKVGWQRLVKRGIHTLRKPQYQLFLFQLCYVDPGIASEEEMEKLKTIDSVFIEI